MYKKGIKSIFRVWVVVLVIFLNQTAAAIHIPEKPQGRVNDLARILTPGEKDTLENLLTDVETKTSSQVALLTIPSLEGEVIEDISLKVAEQWKLGQKGFDNGVLVLVAMADRKIRIEVGYGLESILTDAKSDYIIRKLITPEFKQRHYFAGLDNGLKAVTGLISKEFEITPEQLQKFQQEQKKAKGSHLPLGLIIFGVIILLNIAKGSTRRGGGSGASAVFWGSMLGGGSHRGGGFGGGGFSGGGGSFGGGGASGGW